MILALLMVPGILTLIPAFVLVRDLGLLNTPWALILPWTAGGQVFGILLCRSFFATLPQDLFDAAKIDGAGEIEQYWRIALPLSWPILVTLAIMHLVSTYNDFIWPLLTISDPVPPGRHRRPDPIHHRVRHHQLGTADGRLRRLLPPPGRPVHLRHALLRPRPHVGRRQGLTGDEAGKEETFVGAVHEPPRQPTAMDRSAPTSPGHPELVEGSRGRR